MPQSKVYLLNDLNDFVFGYRQSSSAKPILRARKLKSTAPPCNPKVTDFSFGERIGPNEKKYTSLKVGDNSNPEIKGQDLDNLAEKLLQMNVWVNYEGFCFYNLVTGTVDPTVSSVTNFYKINDLFDWAAYGVNVANTFSSVWNRCEIEGNQTKIDYKKMEDDLKNCQTEVAKKDLEIKNKDAEIKTKGDEITRLNDDIKQKDDDITKLEQQLAQCGTHSSVPPPVNNPPQGHADIVALRSVQVPYQWFKVEPSHSVKNTPYSDIRVSKLTPLDISPDPNFGAFGTIQRKAYQAVLDIYKWKLLMVKEHKGRPIAYYYGNYGHRATIGNDSIDHVPHKSSFHGVMPISSPSLRIGPAIIDGFGGTFVIFL